MSIYDFLDSEVNSTAMPTSLCSKSQELPPSETVAQVDEAPQSALDTTIPTEDTDMSLFSVGDTVKVRQAEEVYTSEDDPESYYYLKENEGKTLTIKIVGKYFLQSECDTVLYFKEAIKI